MIQLVFTALIFIGDVVYVRCFGQPYIVLDSAEAATELLEKQSAIFSSRPNTMVYKL